MKEYGTDLENQYNDTVAKLKSLDSKVRKRCKLLIKQSPNTLVGGEPVNNIPKKVIDDILDIKSILFIIKKIEAEFVENQGKQIDMFNSKKEKK